MKLLHISLLALSVKSNEPIHTLSNGNQLQGFVDDSWFKAGNIKVGARNF